MEEYLSSEKARIRSLERVRINAGIEAKSIDLGDELQPRNRYLLVVKRRINRRLAAGINIHKSSSVR